MTRKIWLDDTPYNWLERNLKRLGTTMLLSAIYDIALGLSLFLFRSWFANLLHLSTLQDQAHLGFWALSHLILPCFCVLAWMDTKRNVVIVTGAIIARTIYAMFMFASILFGNAHPIWAVFGGISLAFGLAHYILLRLSDFGFWEILSRAGNPPGMKRR